MDPPFNSSSDSEKTSVTPLLPESRLSKGALNMFLELFVRERRRLPFLMSLISSIGPLSSLSLSSSIEIRTDLSERDEKDVERREEEEEGEGEGEEEGGREEEGGACLFLPVAPSKMCELKIAKYSRKSRLGTDTFHFWYPKTEACGNVSYHSLSHSLTLSLSSSTVFLSLQPVSLSSSILSISLSLSLTHTHTLFHSLSLSFHPKPAPHGTDA